MRLRVSESDALVLYKKVSLVTPRRIIVCYKFWGLKLIIPPPPSTTLLRKSDNDAPPPLESLAPVCPSICRPSDVRLLTSSLERCEIWYISGCP